MYDVIIIGGGAAGLTAGIYTGRKNLKTLIISVNVGGQTSIPSSIENYPGFDEVNGFELMTKFQAQAMKWGAEIISGKIVKLEKKSDKLFKLTLANKEEYETKSVILAFGKTPNSLDIPGEDKFMGKGVSTCVTCDGPLYRNKTAAIIGGGNSALGGVRELAPIAKKVYLVHRRDAFRGDEVEVKRIKGLKNVEFVLSHVPVEIKGNQFVEGLIVQSINDKKKKTLAVDGVFVEIGFKVDSDFLGDLVKRNEQKEVITNSLNETSQPGIFGAGDVTNVPFKQTVISAGEGAKAALQCYHYLSGSKGKVSIDWKQ
ncbi:MAG: FAD-dependent oxidoreductase [Nanoarchaeota archaeon]|nr:FAD-dependent oxidoreductase [Nanoarchaeota archaeon]MBU1269729.1 FAD-dependent oxidoreductase [Nanoarchaeota archaeon]MBU1604568.1 FAD-dependent oxidoreductase [Nanoarchaeota archaeon]MBU2442824.1 FAD-dependent oxidoreductase [Nanoarchaeota archaeon]